jgi:hypothetical protein
MESEKLYKRHGSMRGPDVVEDGEKSASLKRG